VDGVPRLLAGDEAASEPDEAMALLARLLARSSEIGWRRAAREVLPDGRYILEEARSGYVDLLPIGPSSAVLEVGCSLGQGTEILARRARTVDAVEVVPAQARFAAERLRQEALTNVAVCCAGDDCLLPFEDGRFDVAVLNLVLEWCGQRSGDAEADAGDAFLAAQRRLLAELARTLRPGGTVYVATKNRFGVHYLLGAPDEHSHGLPFASVLPRALVGPLLKATGRPPRPAGRLHSYGALRRLLEEAGFGELRPYWAIPDARYPREYVPADAGSVAAARRRLLGADGPGARRVRLALGLLPAGLVKHVAPSLVFTGVRQGAATASRARAA
jgi:SAM-dependent methyltransferase